MSTNPLDPTDQLLMKLGSIIVHFEEYSSDNGALEDIRAARALLKDDEVKEWLRQMTAMAFLPVKRS